MSTMPERSTVLFVGGRSGVGKTTAAAALHAMLTELDVRHAVIEGDLLDLAHPAPWREGHALAEQNLAAIWQNYRALGHRRLVFTNTVSVLRASELAAAMGDDPRMVSVLLVADDTTVAERLALRERGVELERHVARSIEAAERLDREAPAHVHRVDTTGRTPDEVAGVLLDLSCWVPDGDVPARAAPQAGPPNGDDTSLRLT